MVVFVQLFNPGWEDSFGILHGDAMQRPVLLDEGTAVYSHNLVTGEGRSQYTGGFGILLRLVISRIEYSLVHDEEVGIVPCVFNGIPDVQLVCLEKYRLI